MDCEKRLRTETSGNHQRVEPMILDKTNERECRLKRTEVQRRHGVSTAASEGEKMSRKKRNGLSKAFWRSRRNSTPRGVLAAKRRKCLRAVARPHCASKTSLPASPVPVSFPFLCAPQNAKVIHQPLLFLLRFLKRIHGWWRNHTWVSGYQF